MGQNSFISPQLAYVDNLGSAANRCMMKSIRSKVPTIKTNIIFPPTGSNLMVGREEKRRKRPSQQPLLLWFVCCWIGWWQLHTHPGFGPVQNTTQKWDHSDFNSDGSVMYYLRYAGNSIKAVTDTFKEGDTEVISVGTLQSPFDPSLGDVDLKVFNDSTLLFASNRLGGFGGYDILYAKQNRGNGSRLSILDRV